MTGTIGKSVRGLLTLSGGTRKEPKTNRPWQKRLVLPLKDECAFCSQTLLDEFPIAPNWKTFQNAYTPHSYHRLLIPTECWPEERLWSLGGPSEISNALLLAFREIERTRESMYPMWIFVHVGYGAGQNLEHLHFHLCEAPAEPRECRIDAQEKIRLFDSENFTTSLVGVRAGQAVIEFTPASDNLLLKNPLIDLQHSQLRDELAGEAFRLIESFNSKFNRPDYCLFFAFNSGNNWFGRYTPILNNWGGSEFMALDCGTPFILPWPHEVTRDFILA